MNATRTSGPHVQNPERYLYQC